MSSSSDPAADQRSDPPMSDSTSDKAVESLAHVGETDQQSTTPADGNGEEQGQGEGGGEEEEEEGECGFCLFMKGGGCKDSFVAWEDCIKEAEGKGEDIVDKCYQATSALKLCMEAHADYYAPILGAEKAAEEEALKELEKEKSAGELESSGNDKDKENSAKNTDG